MLRALPVYHARAVTHADVLSLVEDNVGNKYVFVFVNAVTKYTFLVPSKDKTPDSCARSIMAYASVVGMTEIFWSDNGPEYTTQAAQELTRLMGGTWQLTLTYRPQANGIAERMNSEILKGIRVLLLYQDTWERWSSPWVIGLVQLAINTSLGTDIPSAPWYNTGIYHYTALHGIIWFKR